MSMRHRRILLTFRILVLALLQQPRRRQGQHAQKACKHPPPVLDVNRLAATMPTSCSACHWLLCARPTLLRQRFLLCHRRPEIGSGTLMLHCRVLSQNLRYLHRQRRPVEGCRCQRIGWPTASCNFQHVQSSDCRILGHRQRSQRHPRIKSIRFSSTSVLPTASCFMTGGSSFSEDPTASTSRGRGKPKQVSS